jgi:hypothetical protein
VHLNGSIELDWASFDSKLDSISKVVNFTFLKLFDCLAVVFATAFEAAASNWLWTSFLFWFSSSLSLASLALFFGFDFLYVLLRFFTSLSEFFFDNLFGFFFGWSLDYFLYWSGLKNFFLASSFLAMKYPFAVQTSFYSPDH